MKTKISKELKAKLLHEHEGDYDAGDWGAATSTPYRVKTYLTKAQSDRIRAAYDILCGTVSAKLSEIPKSKQENREYRLEWCSLHSDSPDPMNMLQGEKLLGWQLCAKTLDHVMFRNGRGHYELRPLNPDDVVVNGSANCSGYPRYDRVSNVQIYWDSERRLYYVLEWLRARTQPIPEERRRRSWCRGKKKKEFLSECKKLQETLLEAGVEIVDVKYEGRWSKTYIECIAPDATVDLSDRAAAWNSHPAVQAQEPGPQLFAPAPEPELVQEGPRISEPEPVQDDERACLGTVCFTGKLERLLRQEAAAVAKRAGYGVASSVSRGLTYLVTNCPNPTSTKGRRAKELGIKIISEDQFLELCNC